MSDKSVFKDDEGNHYLGFRVEEALDSLVAAGHHRVLPKVHPNQAYLGMVYHPHLINQSLLRTVVNMAEREGISPSDYINRAIKDKILEGAKPPEGDKGVPHEHEPEE